MDVRTGYGMYMKLSGKRAFLLEEVLVSIGIFLLCVMISFPLIENWKHRQVLDMAVIELVGIMREVQISASNDSDKYSNAPENLHFICVDDSERVEYMTLKGTHIIRPKGFLSDSVSMSPSYVEVVFQKEGFSSGQTDYRVMLQTKDKKYCDNIIIAAATGRIRIEHIR